MSIVKRHMEDMEAKHDAAVNIAIEAGVLERCQYCHSTILQGYVEVEEAYKLGNTKYSAGEVDHIFSSRRDMTDSIKDAYECSDYMDDTCHSCHDKMYGDD